MTTTEKAAMIGKTGIIKHGTIEAARVKIEDIRTVYGREQASVTNPLCPSCKPTWKDLDGIKMD